MRIPWTAGACWALGMLLAACGERADGPASVARDSAGVRIVRSDRPAWPDGAGWTVGDAPVLDVGVVEGDAAYQLDGVRSVARLAGGRIAVANGGSGDVRIFGPDGRHQRTLGRRGAGPGEFQRLAWVGAAAGDTLLAWDSEARRLTIFAPGGSFVRTVTPEGIEGMHPSVRGLLADGTILSTGGFSADGFRMGERRETVAYHRFGADGRARGGLGPYPGWETFAMEADGLLLQDPVVFGREGIVRPAGGEVLVADNDRYEIRFLAPDGALRRIVRRAHEPVRVRDADVEAYFAVRDEDIAGLPAAQAAGLRRLRARQREVFPRRETLPAFADARVDAAGSLWVQDFRRPADEQPRWSVFDADGRWLGTVETPAGLEVHQIGPDWILGVQADELEVEHVRVYPLVKPGR